MIFNKGFAHSGSVITIDVKSDDTLIASGSIDSTAKLISPQSGKVLSTFECGDGKGESVESVVFNNTSNVLATGTVAGLIEIWDISSHSRKTNIISDSRLTKIMWFNSNPHVILASGVDGILRGWDSRTGQLVLSKSGHKDQILDFSVAKNSDHCITASDDTTCRVFSLN